MSKPPCRHGTDRSLWRDKVDKKNNVIRTTCVQCGAWIGNRPIDRKQERK